MKHGVESEYAFASSIANRISDSEPQQEVIFPNARSIAMRCILFPMHHKLTNQQVDQIGKVIATLP
jgi:dTDP-4-amino-4,6-dideoxygalactose transaminase